MTWKLCFVKDNCVYFSQIGNPWGDDWDDRPYEHNAGEPYGDYKKVYIDGVMFDTPETMYYPNSPYSVEDINKGNIPWIIIGATTIYAGMEMQEFIKIMMSIGMNVYTVIT